MSPAPPPILLATDDTEIFRLVQQHIAPLRVQAPIMFLPQLPQLRQYLIDATAANRCPSVMVLGIDTPDRQTQADEILPWIRTQPGGLGALEIILLADDANRPPTADPRLAVIDRHNHTALTMALERAAIARDF